MNATKILVTLRFQKSIFLPSIIMSTAINLLGYATAGGEFWFAGIGIGYLLISLCTHYIIYELRNPSVYYLYHNLSLSRAWLWGSTIVLSFIIILITSFL